MLNRRPAAHTETASYSGAINTQIDSNSWLSCLYMQQDGVIS